jgi:ribose/xylose/arabinose/galactoside ABC-type transport system permease subunit
MIAVFVFFAIIGGDSFVSLAGFAGWLNVAAEVGIVALPVVVGGVLLTGGFGSVIGIFFGTLTFAVVNQGIYFTNIDRNWSSLIIGMMLLLAVLMNNLFRKIALTYSPRTKEVRTA